MNFFHLSIFAATVFTTTAAASSTAPNWSQCGGKGYTGPTACEPSSYCLFQSDWYSQCVPGTNPNPSGKNCVATWGQCGGIAFKGPDCCQYGSSCSYQNEWYSQCVPDTIKKPSVLKPLKEDERFEKCAPIYGQCGGEGWTGPTCCWGGFACSYSSSTYSQCLPSRDGSSGKAENSTGTLTSLTPTTFKTVSPVSTAA